VVVGMIGDQMAHTIIPCRPDISRQLQLSRIFEFHGGVGIHTNSEVMSQLFECWRNLPFSEYECCCY
jgi:hypothetical protein